MTGIIIYDADNDVIKMIWNMVDHLYATAWVWTLYEYIATNGTRLSSVAQPCWKKTYYVRIGWNKLVLVLEIRLRLKRWQRWRLANLLCWRGRPQRYRKILYPGSLSGIHCQKYWKYLKYQFSHSCHHHNFSRYHYQYIHGHNKTRPFKYFGQNCQKIALVAPKYLNRG